MYVDIRELTYFTIIVEQRSITRAAEKIGISQPALTKCIRLFEERLGMKLLERSSNGVMPTVYGESLYVRAKSIVAEVSRAEAELKELSGKAAGVVVIGVLPTQAMNVIPEATVQLVKTRPGLHLRVIEKARTELHAGLHQGEFDFIISVIDDNMEEPDIVYRELYRDRPSVIVRQGHPLSGRQKVSSEELLHYPWVVPLLGTLRRTYVDELLDTLKLTVPPNAIECHSISFLKAVVIQTDYVGILPNNATGLEERAGLITSLPTKGRPPARVIGICYRADYPPGDAALTAIRAIQSTCRRLGYRPDTKAVVSAA